MIRQLLVCKFGEDWQGKHPLCAAELARVCGVPIGDVPVPDYSREAVRQLSLFEREGNHETTAIRLSVGLGV